MAPGITVPGKILMTRGIGPLLMMHVPYHHPRDHKLPVYDHRHPVRSVRLPAYSVRSHPVRRRPLCIVLHLRNAQLLLRRRGRRGRLLVGVRYKGSRQVCMQKKTIPIP